MRTTGIVAVVALIIAAGACAFTFVALHAEGEPREVVLVAKDMTFVSGTPTAGQPLNPTIVLYPGERVRLVLRNLDPGMRHDLIVDRLRLRTPALDHGEFHEIVFTAPTEMGEWDYYCSFHSRLMRGRIVVR